MYGYIYNGEVITEDKETLKLETVMVYNVHALSYMDAILCAIDRFSEDMGRRYSLKDIKTIRRDPLTYTISDNVIKKLKGQS